MLKYCFFTNKSNGIEVMEKFAGSSKEESIIHRSSRHTGKK
jgi:hypothetical protein